jgi:hypothetical protein
LGEICHGNPSLPLFKQLRRWRVVRVGVVEGGYGDGGEMRRASGDEGATDSAPE